MKRKAINVYDENKTWSKSSIKQKSINKSSLSFIFLWPCIHFDMEIWYFTQPEFEIIFFIILRETTTKKQSKLMTIFEQSFLSLSPCFCTVRSKISFNPSLGRNPTVSLYYFIIFVVFVFVIKLSWNNF